jgi:hypothetical protein
MRKKNIPIKSRIKRFNLDKSAKLILALEMYESIKNSQHAGFCVAFESNVYRIFYKELLECDEYSFGVFNRFTEIQAFKPKSSHLFWFPVDKRGKQIRLDILDQVIYQLSY